MKEKPPQAGAPPLRWSITDGLALPTSASVHFELQPLSGLPPLYQVLVVQKGRDGEQDRLGEASGGLAEGDTRAVATEVLGLLVDDDQAPPPSPGKWPQLCLLLSLPAIPEDPLARIDLPLDSGVAPPGMPGKRSLADLVLMLGGGLVLSIVHVTGERPGAELTRLVLSIAKPRPAGQQDGPAFPPSLVVQELEIPGYVVGGSAGYSAWHRRVDLLAPEGGRGPFDRDWTTLAIVWTPTQVYTLRSCLEHVFSTLQSQAFASITDAGAPRSPPPSLPIPPELPPELNDEAAQAALAPRQAAGEHLEGMLPSLCWALDVDYDDLMLLMGRRAFAGSCFETTEAALSAALALWARRSTRLVPLTLLMECFGQLAQNVEVVRRAAPAILQVLMPHWPHVVAEMEAAVSAEEAEGAAEGGERLGKEAARDCTGLACQPGAAALLPAVPPARAPGEAGEEQVIPSVTLSTVTWFLSLVVMLLIVMHPRLRGTGEYNRRGRAGPRDFTSEWQALGLYDLFVCLFV